MRNQSSAKKSASVTPIDEDDYYESSEKEQASNTESEEDDMTNMDVALAKKIRFKRTPGNSKPFESE